MAERATPLSPIRSGAASSAPERMKQWLKLLVGVAAVLVFVFGVGSLASLLPGAAHMAQVIEERDLRATAIFYTDFKESAEGSQYIHDALRYPPGREPMK
jgi:hypothetical protein